MGILPEKLIYTGGRVISIAVRPMSLFIANNEFSPDAAQGLAITFLVSTLVMAVIAADPHRRYYALLFSTERPNSSLSFYLYVTSIVMLMMIGSLITLVVAGNFTDSIFFAASVTLYFISEKLADEVLRLKLFERDLRRWGYLSNLRGLIQLGGLGGLFFLFGKNLPGIAIVLTFALINLIVFVPQLSVYFLKSLTQLQIKTVYWLIPRAIRLLISNRILWFIALMGSSVGYLDRIASLVLDKSILPIFALVVMCFSIVQMAVDFYYISPRRRDFLDQDIRLINAMKSREFLVTVTCGFTGALIATGCVLYFSNNGHSFPLVYVAAISVLQTSLAIGLLPTQILYWRLSYRKIFHVEVVFWIFLGFSLLIGHYLGLTLRGFLTLLSLVIIMRLFALMYYAAQADCLSE
jgi:hypothetical protein